MKYYVVFALLVVLQCCYCSPYRPRYDGDEGDAPPYGSKNYKVDDQTHKTGGGISLGGNVGFGIGVSKNGFLAELQKGLNVNWNSYTGTTNTHLSGGSQNDY